MKFADSFLGFSLLRADIPTRAHNDLELVECNELPSGKHTKNYGKSPFSMGKLTINGHVQ